MTFIDGCADCPGGPTFQFAFQPDASIRDIQVTADNVVLIPPPIWPENICLQALANTSVDPATTDNTMLPPIVWNETDCALELGCWPGSTIIDWDSTTEVEPDTTDNPCANDCADKGIVAFRDRGLATPAITHLCVMGELVPLPSGSAPEEGTPADLVCYDVSGWTFPVAYGGGDGEWTVFGADRMDEPCSSGPSQFEMTRKEFACWGDFGGNPGPSNGWNSLGWTLDTYITDPNIVEAVENVSHPCARPAFRLNPSLPVGTSGPIQWTINFTSTSGATRFAMYDIVSGAQLPVTVPSQPSGSTMTLETGPNGPQVFSNGTAEGIYIFEFSLPSGVQAQNVRALAWNMAGVGEPETFVSTSLTAIPSDTTCCNSWNNVNQLLNWLNANDPVQAGWSLQGSTVCQTVAQGVGANYGTLAGCSETAEAVVSSTSVGLGGACPACLSVVSAATDGVATIVQTPGTNFSVPTDCGITASGGQTGTRSGMFVDACEELALPATGTPEDTFPAADFPAYWRQGFSSTDGQSVWTVLTTADGSRQWVLTQSPT